MQPQHTTTTDGGSADIASLHGKDCSYNPIAFPPSMEVRCNLLGQRIVTWMWEVWKMQGAIFNHGHMHCPNKLHLTSMDGGNAIGL